MALDVGDVFESVGVLTTGTSSGEKGSRKEKIAKSITQSAFIIFKNFIWPIMFLIIILLGAMSTMYQYESTFEQDVNESINSAEMAVSGVFGNIGRIILDVYNIGVKNSNWVYYFLLLLAVLALATWVQVYANIKKIWKNGDGLSAQDIIDDINSEMKGVTDKSGSTFKIENLKGGNEYTK